MQCMPKPVTILYPEAKTNHKCFCFVTLPLNRKNSYWDLLCLLLSSLNSYAKCLFFHAYIKAISSRKKIKNQFWLLLTPACAKTAIRTWARFCLENVQSTEYLAKFSLAISRKESSCWFLSSKSFPLWLAWKHLKDVLKNRQVEIRVVHTEKSHLVNGDHPKLSLALKSIEKNRCILFLTSSLKVIWRFEQSPECPDLVIFTCQMFVRQVLLSCENSSGIFRLAEIGLKKT